LSEKDIKGQNLSFDESTEGIQAGNIDAAFITAGTPTGAVEALSVQNDILVLPIADDKIQALVKKYPYYAEDTIPSGTYKIKSEVKTVAVKAMLVVTKDLDEDLVYEMTKAVYENTDQITHAKALNIDNSELTSSISAVWKNTDASILTKHILETLENDDDFNNI